MLTAEQLEARKSGIGGSDAGAVLGLNRYATPLAVYLEKTGQAKPFEGNDATYWGNRLEDLVAEEFTIRTGLKVRRRREHFRHKEHDFMVGNIDRSVDGQKMVLECKTASEYTKNQWGEDGSDEVPDSYLVQCMHYMIVTGYRRAQLAVLIGGNDFRIFYIPYDQGLADTIIEKEFNFWHNHVLKGIAPDPVNFEDLAELYAHDNGQEVLAKQETEQKVIELSEVRAKKKELEQREDALKFDIQKDLGPGAVLINPEGEKLITWKKAKDSKKTGWKDLALHLMSGRPKQYIDNHVSQFTQTTQGSRRFLVKI